MKLEELFVVLRGRKTEYKRQVPGKEGTNKEEEREMEDKYVPLDVLVYFKICLNLGFIHLSFNVLYSKLE